MKKEIKIALTVVFLSLIVAGSAYLIRDYLESKKNNEIYEQVKEEVVLPEPEEVVEEPEPEPIVIPIDFATLKQTNEDVYAWIDIEDTNIHYPILQSATDDLYYLEHTIEGVKGYPGSIYTESVNAKDFSDFNTLIYGHNMKDGSMFKHLHKFADPEFFNSHETIMIYTENAIKEYRIYCAVIYDNRHIMHSFDFSMESERERFISSLEESRNLRNQFREGMEITANDKLVTLSTCTNSPSTRMLVIGAEVER